MRTSILAVGTELLFGQTVNTNAAYLSEQLNLMGFDVMYHYVVGDNPGRLKETLKLALDNTDLVILTGGLGPTQDDLTKEMVAEQFEAELVQDDACLASIREFFDMRGLKMTDNNLKQAMMPRGSAIFRNVRGTAPGFAIEKDGKCAICLPGPPWEMTGMFEEEVAPWLSKFLDKKMYYRNIRTIGIGESELETILQPLIDGQTDPTVATYAKEGEVSFRVASQRPTLDEAKAAVDALLAPINDLAGRFIYSYDDEELNEVVVHRLMDKGLTLSSAESCTGGLFASSITDVAGASNVFNRGYVTYDAEAKITVLGVDYNTIDRYTVVSAEVAREMAEGARLNAGADIAVAITGYAGPSADEGREPGNAFIGYATDEKSGAVEINTMRPFRAWNRNYFRLQMLRVVNGLLNDM